MRRLAGEHLTNINELIESANNAFACRAVRPLALSKSRMAWKILFNFCHDVRFGDSFYGRIGLLGFWCLPTQLGDDIPDFLFGEQQTLGRLQVELSRINSRLDALYTDKLDGKVSELFWMEKSKRWEADKSRISEELNNCRVSDDQSYVQGVIPRTCCKGA